MYKLMTTALIAAGAAMAAPAIAQTYYVDDDSYTVVVDHGYCDGNSHATQIDYQIGREARDDNIDWTTAHNLRAEVSRTADMENHYCATGMTAWRAERLDMRYAQIENELNADAHG
jgi:hypothetical protein